MSRRKIKWVWISVPVLFGFLLFITPKPDIFASPSSQKSVLPLEDLIDRIQQTYNKAKYMTADFTQEAYNQTIGRSQNAKGKVYLKKPNLMRWDYEEPDIQYFIVDGKTFWWYTPESNQVIKQPTAAAFDSRIPLSFLGGLGVIRRDFHIQYSKEKISREGWLSLLLSPRNPTGAFTQLTMEVDPDVFEIRRVIMEDGFGNRTILLLSNMRVNQEISAERFRFDPPPGVQVITPEDFPGGF